MTDPRPRILVADDQADVVEAVRLLLRLEGYDCDAAGSPGGVLAILERGEFDAVLIDLNYARDTTSGAEGLELLGQLRRFDETMPVVVMTAWGTVDLAVEAMRRGAGDFIQKPWENERLLAVLRTQVELGRALRKGRRLEAENALLRTQSGPAMVARSAAMRPVLQVLARVGPSDANVLITGENGTGKSLLAQALHDASPRAKRPFVSVNAGGISEGVFESELFGHERGAFTDARSERMAGRCSSTRSPTCPSRSRQNSCAFSRRASSSGWGRREHGAPAFVSCLQPTPTCTPKWQAGAFDRICCSGSTPSRCTCRRCANGARTSLNSRWCSSIVTRSATARPLAASRRRQCRSCSSTPGQGTSANSIMRSNVPS
jgi:FixJ family two-component response regulator